MVLSVLNQNMLYDNYMQMGASSTFQAVLKYLSLIPRAAHTSAFIEQPVELPKPNVIINLISSFTSSIAVCCSETAMRQKGIRKSIDIE